MFSRFKVKKNENDKGDSIKLPQHLAKQAVVFWLTDQINVWQNSTIENSKKNKKKKNQN